MVMRTTNRGGWQGSQQMMHMFAMGLEEVFGFRRVVTENEGTMRIGYADDLHFCGKTTWLAKRWPMIVAALAEAGLEAQPTKSKFWSPTADLKDSHQLPPFNR